MNFKELVRDICDDMVLVECSDELIHNDQVICTSGYPLDEVIRNLARILSTIQHDAGVGVVTTTPLAIFRRYPEVVISLLVNPDHELKEMGSEIAQIIGDSDWTYRFLDALKDRTQYPYVFAKVCADMEFRPPESEWYDDNIEWLLSDGVKEWFRGLYMNSSMSASKVLEHLICNGFSRKEILGVMSYMPYADGCRDRLVGMAVRMGRHKVARDIATNL